MSQSRPQTNRNARFWNTFSVLDKANQEPEKENLFPTAGNMTPSTLNGTTSQNQGQQKKNIRNNHNEDHRYRKKDFQNEKDRGNQIDNDWTFRSTSLTKIPNTKLILPNTEELIQKTNWNPLLKELTKQV